jgi:hypothetical protein
MRLVVAVIGIETTFSGNNNRICVCSIICDSRRIDKHAIVCETKFLAALDDDDRNAALVIRVMVNLPIVWDCICGQVDPK